MTGGGESHFLRQAESPLSGFRRLEFEEYLSLFDGLAGSNTHGFDDSLSPGFELVLHLHCLENHQSFPGFNPFAGFDLNPKDEARHGRFQQRTHRRTVSAGGQAPNVSGALVENLDLPSFTTRNECPAAAS